MLISVTINGINKHYINRIIESELNSISFAIRFPLVFYLYVCHANKAFWNTKDNFTLLMK
jgi:hypothetical protein